MKKINTILLLLLLISQITIAQWSNGWHLAVARSGLDVVEYNGKIYAIGGWGDNQKLEVYENNIWKDLAQLPQAQAGLAAARVGDKIYTFGSEGPSDITQIYDIATDTWQFGPNIPIGLYYATAEAVGNKIYLIGGYSSTALNTLYVLDTEANTWTQGANLPTSIHKPSSAEFGGNIYVFGNEVYLKYDILNDSWSTFSGPPSGHGSNAEAVNVNNEIYLMGGSSSNIYEAYKTVEIYNPITNAWSEGPELSVGRYQFGAAYCCNKLYVIGGRDKNALDINNVGVLRFEFFTGIGGTITENTTLYLSGSPYIAKNDISVASGVTLTIEDGVIIKFPFNYFGISVLGTLNANGVTFTAEDPPTDPCGSYWQAIFFWPGSTGELVNCTIEYAGSIVRQYHPDHFGDGSDPSYYIDALGNVVIRGNATVTLNNCTSRYSNRSGIWTEAVTTEVKILSLISENNVVDGLHCESGSMLEVSNSQFRFNNYYGAELINSSPSFTSCTFSNNPGGFHCLSGSNPSATGCQFLSNLTFGARVVDSNPFFIASVFSNNLVYGLWTVNSQPSFTGGRFENNEQYGIYIDGTNVPSLNGVQLIAGNGLWGVMNQTTTVISAKKIYWGDPTGPHDEYDNDGLGLLNLDGLGDNVSEYVDWNPFRTTILQVDPNLSEISVEPKEIRADGQSTAVITVIPKAPNGNLVGSGLEVFIYTTAGTLAQKVTDNHDGSYTQQLTAPAAATTAIVTANVEGILLNNSVGVVFYGAIDPSKSTVVAEPVEILADGKSTSIITVVPKDAKGNNAGKGLDVQIFTTAGTLKGNVHTEQDGTYWQELQSSTTEEVATVTAEVNGIVLEQSATVSFSFPPPPPTIDLGTQADVRIDATGQGNCGEVVVAGDFDGDGYDDLIVSDKTAKVGNKKDAGKVYVLFGSESLPTLMDLPASAGTTILGEASEDKLGSALACGDVNDDNMDDIIIGTQPISGPSGKAYIIYGGSREVTINLANLPSSRVTKIFGGSGGLSLGLSVATGYVDGDSYADVLVSAPNADPVGRTDAGQVYVLRGSELNGGVNVNLDIASAPLITTILGETAGDFLGINKNSIWISHYLNDPFGEILITSLFHQSASGRKGTVYVVKGNSTLPQYIDLDNTSLLGRFDGAYDNRNNYQVHVISGDLDGDSNDDLVISAQGEASLDGSRAAGITYVFYGNSSMIGNIDLFANWPNLVKIYGESMGDCLGFSVMGDFNDNAINDLVTFAQGEDNSAGIGYMFYGGSRPIEDIDLADPFALIALTIHGNSKDLLGGSAAIGDFDGDDRDDILIGAPDSVNSTGEAYVLLGTTLSGILSKRTIEMPLISSEVARIPHNFSLEQNYPNPFNPTTKIVYGLPANSFVNISIYDVLGNLVMNLVNGEKTAGYHSVEFGASKLPCGVYIYRITAGDFINAKKTILLR